MQPYKLIIKKLFAILSTVLGVLDLFITREKGGHRYTYLQSSCPCWENEVLWNINQTLPRTIYIIPQAMAIRWTLQLQAESSTNTHHTPYNKSSEYINSGRHFGNPSTVEVLDIHPKCIYTQLMVHRFTRMKYRHTAPSFAEVSPINRCPFCMNKVQNSTL